MSRQPAVPATSVLPGIGPSQPLHVVYERPRPRIAKGIVVLLLAGPLALIIFAMGQTVWGALWRGWLITILAFLAITYLRS